MNTIQKLYEASFHFIQLHLCCCTVLCHSCPALCDPMDCSPPGSPVHGIFQARTLGWVAISFSRRSSQPRDWTHNSCVSCIGRRILYHCMGIMLGGNQISLITPTKSLPETMSPSSTPTGLTSPHCHSSMYKEIIKQWIKNSKSWKLQQNSRKTTQLF